MNPETKTEERHERKRGTGRKWQREESSRGESFSILGLFHFKLCSILPFTSATTSSNYTAACWKGAPEPVADMLQGFNSMSQPASGSPGGRPARRLGTWTCLRWLTEAAASVSSERRWQLFFLLNSFQCLCSNRLGLRCHFHSILKKEQKN